MAINYKHIQEFDEMFPSVTHFITTRYGGVSKGNYAELNMGKWCGDCPACVQSNRQHLCQSLGISEDLLLVPREIHKTHNVIIDNDFLCMPFSDRASLLMEADALITTIPNVAIAVSTADCVPVLLYDAKHKIAAAIHAGWRGIIGGILYKTNETLNNLFDNDVSQRHFIIGPCIAGCNYEIKNDVWQQFCKTFTSDEQKKILTKQTSENFYPELRTAVTLQLENIVDKKQIHQYIADTFTNKDFYSVRRDGQNTGRFLTGIMLQQ